MRKPANNGAPRLALLCNVISPYRAPVYQEIARRFDVEIFHSGMENRDYWKEEPSGQRGFAAKRSLTITLRTTRKSSGAVFDQKFIQLPVGMLFDVLRFRPAAILSNEMGLRSLIALFCGALLGVPVWVWWGGTLHTERGRGALKRAFRKVFVALVRRWISYGETSTEYLRSIGIPAARILQIQNCVDERVYSAETAPALSLEPRPVLLCVGQLIGRKGVDELLHAAARLQKEGRRFTLLLVGSGPEKPRLEQLARELGLRDCVFHPPQPPERMPAIYRSADALVFPTLEDVWGLVANEAIWAGLPVLVSRHAGCAPEIVPESAIFDPLDPASFDRALRSVLDGTIARPDRSRLRTCAQVGEAIARDVLERLQT